MPRLCKKLELFFHLSSHPAHTVVVVGGVVAVVLGAFAPGATPLLDAVKVASVVNAAMDAATINPPHYSGWCAWCFFLTVLNWKVTVMVMLPLLLMKMQQL